MNSSAALSLACFFKNASWEKIAVHKIAQPSSVQSRKVCPVYPV